MQFEWSHGRRLEKASNQSYNVSYKYDDGGIRTSKTVNGVTTEFITSGIQILAQKTGNNILVWQVDGNGETVGFNYNGTEYFYLKSAQGDIAGITDASGNVVAEYVYDSWGKMLSVKDASGTEITDSSNIAKINPLRYRGYYYDSELGLYYLNARYYDPEIGRFINADDEDFLLDKDNNAYNLFAYCYNNPINYLDPSGEIAVADDVLIVYAAGATATMTLTAYYAWLNSPEGKKAQEEGAKAFQNGIEITVKAISNAAKWVGDKAIETWNWAAVSLAKVANPDPYARPGQKNQGRENKNKSRRDNDWRSRSNKRRPSQPKKHTPGRNHRKY